MYLCFGGQTKLCVQENIEVLFLREAIMDRFGSWAMILFGSDSEIDQKVFSLISFSVWLRVGLIVEVFGGWLQGGILVTYVGVWKFKILIVYSQVLRWLFLT